LVEPGEIRGLQRRFAGMPSGERAAVEHDLRLAQIVFPFVMTPSRRDAVAQSICSAACQAPASADRAGKAALPCPVSRQTAFCSRAS
jgi:hypothetical protein